MQGTDCSGLFWFAVSICSHLLLVLEEYFGVLTLIACESRLLDRINGSDREQILICTVLYIRKSIYNYVHYYYMVHHKLHCVKLYYSVF